MSQKCKPFRKEPSLYVYIVLIPKCFQKNCVDLKCKNNSNRVLALNLMSTSEGGGGGWGRRKTSMIKK